MLAGSGLGLLPAAGPTAAPRKCHCECKRGSEVGGGRRDQEATFHDSTHSPLTTEGPGVPVAERPPQPLRPGKKVRPERRVGAGPTVPLPRADPQTRHCLLDLLCPWVPGAKSLQALSLGVPLFTLAVPGAQSQSLHLSEGQSHLFNGDNSDRFIDWL